MHELWKRDFRRRARIRWTPGQHRLSSCCKIAMVAGRRMQEVQQTSACVRHPLSGRGSGSSDLGHCEFVAVSRPAMPRSTTAGELVAGGSAAWRSRTLLAGERYAFGNPQDARGEPHGRHRFHLACEYLDLSCAGSRTDNRLGGRDRVWDLLRRRRDVARPDARVWARSTAEHRRAGRLTLIHRASLHGGPRR